MYGAKSPRVSKCHAVIKWPNVVMRSVLYSPKRPLFFGSTFLWALRFLCLSKPVSFFPLPFEWIYMYIFYCSLDILLLRDVRRMEICVWGASLSLAEVLRQLWAPCLIGALIGLQFINNSYLWAVTMQNCPLIAKSIYYIKGQGRTESRESTSALSASPQSGWRVSPRGENKGR